MTGPASAGTERGTRAPSRATGTQGAVGAVLVVLALGLVLRLIIAQLLPGSGFDVDRGAFQFWAADLAKNGPWGFYDRPFFHDYTPGYLYVLWLVGIVGNLFGGIGDLIKVPPILADLAIGWLAWSMVRELGGRDRLALVAAFVAVLNPIFWFDSVVWGQVDSFGVVFVLLALRELWRDNPERSAIYAVIAAVIKPQLGILIPLVAVVTIRRAFWPAGGHGDAARTGKPLRVLTTGLAGFVTAVVLCLPFGLSVIWPTTTPPFIDSGLLRQVAVAAGGYPYLTVNAYNPWAIVPGDLGYSLANAGQWVCDFAGSADQCGSGSAVFGALPAVLVGTALLLAAIVVTLVLVARRPDRLTLLVGLAVLTLAFFVVPTRVHERYGFPFFALGVILAVLSWRWAIAYAVLSVATFLNMYVVLTTLYPNNPSIQDWLGIGPSIRSEPGVILIALLHLAGFGWAFLQLRASARRRLEDEVTAASRAGEGTVERPDGDDPWVAVPGRRPVAQPMIAGALAGAGAGSGPGAGSASPGTAIFAGQRPTVLVVPPAFGARDAGGAGNVATPTWTPRPTFAELGIIGWFRSRLGDAPVRPDRSATLVAERGGRLDRLDLWFLVVLVIATMTLRTFRLAEPYQMHFDEVYHARTAAEFLQDWRYGLSHDIYEWTHPHLAKYAMAAGIVLWGQDDVSATSELGVPATASVVEPRREDSATPGQHAGERLHVATGTEVRTYDLVTRQLISVIPAAGSSALAIDASTRQLVIGYNDGRIATLDLATIGVGGVDTSPEPSDVGQADHPVAHLLVTDDGTAAIAASADRLTVLDLKDGTVRGTKDLAGIAALSPGGTGAALVADIDSVKDVPSAAAKLADILSGKTADYETKLSAGSPGTTVVLGSPGTGDARKALDAAVADGTLPGVHVEDVERIAVADADGVTFLDPTRTSVISTVSMNGGAHGLALVTGVDDPKLYVTSGPPADPGYDIVAVGGDAAKDGPTGLGKHPLPGPGTWVAYDAASQQVHILGLAQNPDQAIRTGTQGAWTVYVVEPHGNAVYADARLPEGFVPAAWASDIEPDYPSTDRQQLLLFAGNGASASINLGYHAFAWRLPGVIAGAITAALLYLLTRILFRRRLVAALVGLFVLVDGMFFVQSRIGMNDVYVGLFIIAAYTLFAAIWTGWWRGRATVWLGFPAIGLLLGLALASKWVAAYAIGALVLLILVRSALGRVLAILGLIGITAVLGYMAITVPEGQGFGNLTFLLIMVALTLTAVVVAILHPIAWTDEELRFAVGAPVIAGTVLFFGTLARGSLQTVITLGPVSVTPLLVAIALGLSSVAVAALFWFGARIGFGPLASPPGIDDPGRLLEPPAAPPEGWLRPGWLLGLPVVWVAACLIVLPLAVYIVSYIPWAMIENHQIIEGWPPGHTGQTLLDLTRQMYAYHNGLTAAHPASSPWWAWPMNLKPVWFYQETLGSGTSAALYDAGSLVIWWLGIPAMAFVSWMAYRRRSLALALIAIGFAAQWIPWARIDRAAFQYHYYTALPFVVMALAYFVAELWHGASRHTWVLARVAAGVAILGPALMWIVARPLCAFVNVLSVNPGSQACPAVIPDAVVTARTAALAFVVGIGVLVLLWRFLEFERGGSDSGRGTTSGLLSMGAAATVVVVGLIAASLLPETPILNLTNLPVEPIAVIAAIPLGYLALQVVAARDARRFVVGYLVAAIGWFVVLYPNISALPLPSAMVNAYQGILPTYLYAFQFPVSTIDRNKAIPILTPTLLVLTIVLTVACLVVAYSAWVWRLARAESAAARTGSGDIDGLARSGDA